MFNKHALLLGAALCAVFTSAQAVKDNPGEEGEEGTYTRPGTNLVVKATGNESSKQVRKILEENREVIAPTATLERIDRHFPGSHEITEGPVGQILDLYGTDRADLTIAQQALDLLPKGLVLAVHTFQSVTTTEGKPAISVINTQSQNGAPTQFTSLLKLQTRDGKSLLDINVVLDITGGNTPQVNVVETPTDTPEGIEAAKKFTAEVKALGSGVKNVSVFAPEDNPIPVIKNGERTTVTGVRRKIALK